MAFTLLLSIVETCMEMIYCIGYCQKMTISYFVSKRELNLVRKSIK